MGTLHRLGHDSLENVEHWFEPELCGKYGIPVMEATHTVGTHFERFTDFYKSDDLSETIAHFFYDDYRFIANWRHPDKHIDRLLEYKAVVAPDFSMYVDMPLCLQILSQYRRQWLGAYWQYQGIDVIPEVTWGLRESYEFCFDGIPKHSTVCISTVGIKREREWNGKDGRFFMDGYDEMMSRLEPETVLIYGTMIKGIYGNVVHVDTFYDAKRERLNEMQRAARMAVN